MKRIAMQRAGAAVLALCWLVSSPDARAQAPADAGTEPPGAVNEVDEARERFLRGVELYKEGSFDAALAEFTRAYQLVPNYRVLYNIAQVHVERHDYAAALRYFADYLRQGAADVSSERREQVEREIASLKARIAELTVTSNVSGAELSIDGAVVGTLPLRAPLIVSSGVRRLVLRKSGYAVAERTISIAGGDKPEIELRLEPTKSAEAAQLGSSSAAPAEVSRPVRAGVWVGLATTTALAGTAVLFGALAARADDDLDQELDRFPANATRIDDARSSLKLYAALTDGFAAGAAVSALVTTYLALSGSSRSENVGSTARRTRLVPTSNGFSVQGRF